MARPPEALATLLAAVLVFAVQLGPAAAADAPPGAKARLRPSGDEGATHPGPSGDHRARPEPADGAGTPNGARGDGPDDAPSSVMEARLREYEIRLAAHRRELMQREAALDAARRRIEELTAGRGSAESTPPPRSEPPPTPEPSATSSPIPSPTAEVSAKASDDPPHQEESLVKSLRQELDAERENRATLEREMKRLVSDSRSPAPSDTLTRSLEGARAEILVLTHRLEEERRAREMLEVEMERVRSSAGITPGKDWADRFATAMEERRERAERLRRELTEANETAVALRGKLEAAGSSAPNDTAALEALTAENQHLQRQLEGAERVNAELRAQAELASRLAELLYAQPMK